MSREHTLKLLWNGFKCHLINTWDHYVTFGSDLQEAKDQIKFCEAVIGQMETDFQEQGIDFETLNHLTLYNYFKTDGFSVNAKTKTLNIFSAFIGHNNWQSFLEKVKNGEITPETYAACAHELQGNSPTTSNVFQASIDRVFIFIVFIAAVALIFFIWRNAHLKYDQKAKVVQVVKAANASEFQAYKNVPQIDSVELRKYFTEDGTAYNSVLGILLRSQKRNRKLLIPPSSYVIESIEVSRVGKEEAVVETREHWIVRWYDAIADKELLYDTVNQHTYFLRNIDGNWKVHVDAYSGKARLPASSIGK